VVELPPELERLLEAARRGHEPSVADYERVRQGVSAALGAQAAPGASEGSVASTGGSTLGTLASSTGGKVLLVAALMGGAGGVWTWHSRSESRGETSNVAATGALAPVEPAPQPSLDAPAAASVELGRERDEVSEVAQQRAPADVSAEVALPRGRVRSRPAHLLRPARGPAPRQALARAHESDQEQPAFAKAQASAEPTPRARAPRAASEPPPLAAPAEQVTSVRAPGATEVARERVKPESEVALIREALASLNANDAQRALELLDAYGLRYPLGAMGRERAGLRVLALCALGRVQEGRREQAAFLEAGSDSPLQNRVRRACEVGAEAPDSARAPSPEPRR
jgi:hypothetical protein